MVFRYAVLAFYFTYLTLFCLRFFRPLSFWVEDGFPLWGTCFLFYLLNPIQVTLFFDLCLSGWRMLFRYEVLAFYFTYLTLFSLRFFRPLLVWVEGGFSLWGICFLFYLLNPYSAYAFFDLSRSGLRMVFRYEVLAFYFTYLTLFSLRFFRHLSVWVEGGFSLWGNCYLFYLLNPIQLTLLSTSVFLGGGKFSVMRYLLSILLT